ncbi:sulfite exporter TauE/SafE family protein [Aquimarina longa]|uniref:sulfite exporter TauE/SafE family protein n=1 Tax=Aquimarina longa TaxID=1080221 RepID=UPI000782CDA1|nr:sulfite exporter TauE/SafE family protein [Aquimarina longa]
MLISAFILGLLGSFHCIGMCGPIAFMLPVNRSNTIQKFFQVFLYHLGRLLAYSIIGLFFGVIGKSLNLFGLQQKLSIAVGVVMIIVVLIPYHFFIKYNFSKPIYRIIAKVKNGLGAALKKKTPDTFLSIGFLNGFLPCGLVYMAVFGAIGSGHILKGSLYMLLFGLGTIPLMTIAVYIGNFLTQKSRQYIQQAIPIFVILIGLLFIIRGLGLGIPYLSPKPVVEEVSANFDCH